MKLLAILALASVSMAAPPALALGPARATAPVEPGLQSDAEQRAAHAPRATLVPAPAEAQIGEPIEFLLDVVHAAGARVRFPEKEAEDRAWVRLSERSVTRAADPGDPALAHTLARWSAMALEPGERSPPALALEVVEGALVQKLTVEALPVHVLEALAEREDAPRPLLGFRDVPEDLEPARRGPWVAAGVLAACSLGLALFLIARRQRPAHVATLTPLARLDALAARFAATPEGGRDCVYDLARLLRDSVDGFLEVERSALTDEGWSAAVAADEHVLLGVRNASTRLLARAERIKYAAETPTRFAVDEFLKDARAALEALAEAERTKAVRAA